ncbi:MAG: tetratricopeptide tpr1 repeat-containing protein, partial [Parcubacteria group bacterium Athens0416_74]
DSYEHAALLFGALYLGAFHIVYVPTVVLSALTFLLLGVLASADGVRSWSLGFSSESWKGRVRTALFALTILAIIVASLGALRATVSEILVNRSGAAYRKNSDAVQALSLLQTALLVYPNNDRAHRAAVELGLIRLGELVAAGDTTDQATAVLQVSLETTIQHGLAAVSINSGDYQNWLALAGLYKNLAGAGVQGAFENAEAAFEKVSADNPLSPLPLVQRAQLYIAKDDLPQAIMLLDRAISLKSNFAAAYLLRSQVHAALGNREASVKDAAVVAQIAPEDSISWYNLGAILYDAGSYVEAVQSLEKAVALQNNYANALFLLGLSYEKLGRAEDALAMLESAARTNPGDATLAGIIENIRAGLPPQGGENTR